MADTQDEKEKLYGTARYWQRELDEAGEFEKEWRERGTRVVERYRDERETGMTGPLSHRFNILWSNTETLKGALFAKMALPDVRRRFNDGDAAARQVAIVLERALLYGLDVYDSEQPIRAALEDYLLPGRGVVWVVYEPIIVKEKTKIEIKGEGVDLVEEEEVERLGDQRCRFEYVHWQDYRESPTRRPEDVTWRARRHLFTRDELIGRGFDHAEDVSLNWTPDTSDYNDTDDSYNRAEVWEIWDKVKRRRLFVATGYKDVLADDDDPYELENFFPCPTPLIAVRTNNTSVPVPEFTIYQDQADELDRVTTRITSLIEGLKRRGVYDASIPELAHLATASDNEFVPSDNFANLAQRAVLAARSRQKTFRSSRKCLQGCTTSATKCFRLFMRSLVFRTFCEAAAQKPARVQQHSSSNRSTALCGCDYAKRTYPNTSVIFSASRPNSLPKITSRMFWSGSRAYLFRMR